MAKKSSPALVYLYWFVGISLLCSVFVIAHDRRELEVKTAWDVVYEQYTKKSTVVLQLITASKTSVFNNESSVMDSLLNMNTEALVFLQKNKYDVMTDPVQLQQFKKLQLQLDGALSSIKADPQFQANASIQALYQGIESNNAEIEKSIARLHKSIQNLDEANQGYIGKLVILYINPAVKAMSYH